MENSFPGMWSHLRRWKRCLRQSQKMRKVAAVNRYVSSMLACVLLMTDTELSVPPLLYLGVHQHLRRVGSINHYDRKNTTHRHSLFYKGQLIRDSLYWLYAQFWGNIRYNLRDRHMGNFTASLIKHTVCTCTMSYYVRGTGSDSSA